MQRDGPFVSTRLPNLRVTRRRLHPLGGFTIRYRQRIARFLASFSTGYKSTTAGLLLARPTGCGQRERGEWVAWGIWVDIMESLCH